MLSEKTIVQCFIIVSSFSNIQEDYYNASGYYFEPNCKYICSVEGDSRVNRDSYEEPQIKYEQNGEKRYYVMDFAAQDDYSEQLGNFNKTSGDGSEKVRHAGLFNATIGTIGNTAVQSSRSLVMKKNALTVARHRERKWLNRRGKNRGNGSTVTRRPARKQLRRAQKKTGHTMAKHSARKQPLRRGQKKNIHAHTVTTRPAKKHPHNGTKKRKIDTFDRIRSRTRRTRSKTRRSHLQPRQTRIKPKLPLHGTVPRRTTKSPQAVSELKVKKKKARLRNLENPLVLTKYINTDRHLEGIKAAKVDPLIKNIKSYAGFLEVNEKYQSYMFFWYFRPQKRFKRDELREVPVIVWLQGGMGHSSLYSALRSNGPIRLERDGSLTYNEYSWAGKAHLVYFDNPVGAGFSFTKKGGYSKNSKQVADNLFEALKQYLTLFRLADNPLYLTGQSYAGKYITALGVKIDEERDNFYINFEGVAIGNGFIDPPNMLRYGAYLYQLGLVDSKTRDRFRQLKNLIRSLLKQGKRQEALETYEYWIAGDVKGDTVPLIEQIVGLDMNVDYRRVGKAVDEKELLNNFLSKPHVKKALNVGGIPFKKFNERCKQALWQDLLNSEVDNLKKLLNNNYRVLLYSGQMSLKNAYPLMIYYIRKMRWKKSDKYLGAFRKVWRVGDDVAGYFQKGSNLEDVLVRNAGRNVPADQPKWAQRMIENFIYRESLNAEPPKVGGSRGASLLHSPLT